MHIRSIVRSVHRLVLLSTAHAFVMKKFLIGGSAPKSVAPVVANKIAASLTLKSELSSSTTSDLSKPIAAEDDKSHIFNTTSSFTSLDDMNISKSLRDFISWQPGESIPYAVVVNTFEDVSRLSGRLDKENLLAKLFASVICTSPSELEAIVYLTSNNVYPVYEGLELGVGDSLLVKAVCEATGRKKDAVDEAYEKEGDLGVVAVQSRTSQKTLGFGAKPKPLMASYVLDQFRQITQIKGEKAQARKVEIIKSLMVRCQGQEAKYIVRALQGKLRIGTAEQTVLVALAHALIDSQKKDKTVTDTLLEDSDASGDEQSNDKKSKKLDSMKVTSPDMTLQELLGKVDDVETFEARKLRLHAEGNQQLSKEKLYEYAEIAVKRAYSECPNLGLLLEASVTKPLHQLYQNCKLRNGVPVAPMLAKPTKEINEVLRRLSGQAFTMEYKYDGERAQVHLLPDSSVKIFSRNSEDNTEKYPDLREVIRKAKVEGVESCIIDAEVVAYDREKGCLLPFQVLSTRKRKVESGDEDNQKVKVILQVFDLLYLNGKSLLRESLRTRRELLRKAFQHTEAYLHFASGMDHIENGDTLPIETFLTEACNAASEGLMVKTLDDNATYEPSKRSLNWLKLKKDYINGMGVCDSVDLVPIGGYFGRGKRVNVYGAYLMACYDPERDEYQSVCKVGTGFKDEDLVRLSELMKQHLVVSNKKPVNYNVGEALYPDEWFETGKITWELQAADLSRSSVHRGGVGRVDSNLSRGIGLRFPRFIRERDDKNAEMATTSEQIVEMFYNQGVGNPMEDEANGEEDDDLI